MLPFNNSLPINSVAGIHSSDGRKERSKKNIADLDDFCPGPDPTFKTADPDPALDLSRRKRARSAVLLKSRETVYCLKP
jgi:hypothetical protein